MLTANSQIDFYHLRGSVEANDSGELAVFRPDTDEAVELDPQVVEIIKSLATGSKIKDVARDKGLSNDEIISVVETLIEIGFVKSVNGKVIKHEADKVNPFLSRVDRKYFMLLFSKPVIYALTLFTLFGILLGFLKLNHFPNYRQYFWHNNLLLVYATANILSILSLALHELAHYAATRAIGGRGSFRFSTRFVFLVAETHSYGLSVIPRELRYLVYLAGMFTDLLGIATVYWIFYLASIWQVDLGIFQSIMQIVVLHNFVSVIWQFNVFVETDVYNFLTDFLRQSELRANAVKFIKHQLERASSKLPIFAKKIIGYIHQKLGNADSADDFRTLTDFQKKQVGLYSLIMLLGLGSVFYQYAFFTIPKEVTFVSRGFAELFTSLLSGKFIPALSSILLLFLVLYPYVMITYLKIKQRGKFHDK
jgi:hypothetical protein